MAVKETLNKIFPWPTPGPPPILCSQPSSLKIRGCRWYFSGYLSIYFFWRGTTVDPLISSVNLAPFAMNLAKIHECLWYNFIPNSIYSFSIFAFFCSFQLKMGGFWYLCSCYHFHFKSFTGNSSKSPCLESQNPLNHPFLEFWLKYHFTSVGIFCCSRRAFVPRKDYLELHIQCNELSNLKPQISLKVLYPPKRSFYFNYKSSKFYVKEEQ